LSILGAFYKTIASILTSKGDILGFSTTAGRLSVGANDTVLTADSGEALGIKWATAGGGEIVQLATHEATSTESTTTLTFSATSEVYSEIMIVIDGVITGALDLLMTYNDKTVNYYTNLLTQASTTITGYVLSNTSAWELINSEALGTGFTFGGVVRIGMNENGDLYTGTSHMAGGTVTNVIGEFGHPTGSADMTSLTFTTSTSTWKAGTRFTVYGVKITP